VPETAHGASTGATSGSRHGWQRPPLGGCAGACLEHSPNLTTRQGELNSAGFSSPKAQETPRGFSALVLGASVPALPGRPFDQPPDRGWGTSPLSPSTKAWRSAASSQGSSTTVSSCTTTPAHGATSSASSIGVTPRQPAASSSGIVAVTVLTPGSSLDSSARVSSHRSSPPASPGMRRLIDQRPDLADRVERGELTVHAACVEAGIRKRR
jgi:hypothetical protein